MLFQDTSCSHCNSGHSDAHEVALKRLCCRRASKGSPGGQRTWKRSKRSSPDACQGAQDPSSGSSLGRLCAWPRGRPAYSLRGSFLSLSPCHPLHCPSTQKGKPQRSACHSARHPRPPTLSRGTASCGHVLTSTWTPALQK